MAAIFFALSLSLHSHKRRCTTQIHDVTLAAGLQRCRRTRQHQHKLHAFEFRRRKREWDIDELFTTLVIQQKINSILLSSWQIFSTPFALIGIGRNWYSSKFIWAFNRRYESCLMQLCWVLTMRWIWFASLLSLGALSLVRRPPNVYRLLGRVVGTRYSQSQWNGINSIGFVRDT